MGSAECRSQRCQVSLHEMCRGNGNENTLLSNKCVKELLFRRMAAGTIRDFPNHATFRVKGANLAWLDKLGGFFSLNLCNMANFDPI